MLLLFLLLIFDSLLAGHTFLFCFFFLAEYSLHTLIKTVMNFKDAQAATINTTIKGNARMCYMYVPQLLLRLLLPLVQQQRITRRGNKNKQDNNDNDYDAFVFGLCERVCVFVPCMRMYVLVETCIGVGVGTYVCMGVSIILLLLVHQFSLNYFR